MNTQFFARGLQYLQYVCNIAILQITRKSRGCNAMQYLSLEILQYCRRAGVQCVERAIFCALALSRNFCGFANFNK